MGTGEDWNNSEEWLLEELRELKRCNAGLEAAGTELLRVKKALEQGAEPLKTLLKNSLDILGMLDARGIITYVNPSAERITGYDPEELTDKYFFDFIHPDDVRGLLEDFQTGIKTPGLTQKREFRYRHKDGSWHYLEANGYNFVEDPVVGGVVFTGRDTTEQHRMERALRASEHRYRALVESQAVGISEVDRQKRFIYANRAAHEIFGVPRGELIGRSLEEFTDRDNFSIIRKQTLSHEAGMRSTYDIEIKRPDGERRILRVTAAPRMDDEGRFIASLAVLSDLTESKSMQDELQESEERYRLIYDHTGDAIFTFDLELRLLGMNRRASELMGYSEEELVGHNILELGILDKEELEKASGNIRRMLSGQVMKDEFRFIKRDGTVIYGEGIGAPLYNSKGEITTIINIVREITARKRSEEMLRQRGAYYKSLLSNSGEMIVVLDADLSFRWGSRSANRITGYGPEDIYGKVILNFIHTDDIGKVRELTKLIMEDPGVPKSVECRFRHKDGSYHFHEALVNNLLDEPAVQGIILNSRDVTERKIMEEQILARNRELDTFAYTISHDLRTPLSLMEGYTQLLQDCDASDEDRARYMQGILHASRRMDELTSSLLDYAQAGRPEGEVSRIAPVSIIKEIVMEHAEAIESRGLEVVVDEELPAVMADPLRMRQVFSNLLNNAVKYTVDKQRPRIEVGAESAGGVVTFYVRDNGVGIEPDVREEIFEPFKRFIDSDSPGLGIGLSTVKQAVEGWGGKIWVVSSPGRGSSFFFTAPEAEN
ncbi:MAG: PAS domain S-box protein [Actinomycetota bacterium]|nr:PAS domain S-box protein [Actinomycetota bacterium]